MERSKSDIRFLYMDNQGNAHFLRHKLKRYKKKQLGWYYIRKLYKLKMQLADKIEIHPIKVEPPKFKLAIQPIYLN